MFIVWAIEYLGLRVSGIIYILPAIAILALLIRLFYNKSVMK